MDSRSGVAQGLSGSVVPGPEQPSVGQMRFCAVSRHCIPSLWSARLHMTVRPAAYGLQRKFHLISQIRTYF